MADHVRYGFVVNLDVQDSGRLADPDRPPMRAELYRISVDALNRAGIADSQVYREDRGDGILFVFSPAVAPQRVLGEWLEYLYQNLRSSNRQAREVLRLRAGLNIGPVTTDEHGRSGRAVDLACRIGNCEEAKRLLRAAPAAHLLVAVSDSLFAEVVRGGGRWIEPENYLPQVVRLPEGDHTVWFHLPRVPVPLLPPTPSGEGPAPVARGRGAAPDREPVPPAPGRPADSTESAASRRPVEEPAGGRGPVEESAAGRQVIVDNHGSGVAIGAGSIGTINNHSNPPAPGSEADR